MLSSLLIAAALVAGSAKDCTMQPPRIDAERLQRSEDVIAATVDREHARSSALLKDGRLLRIVAMGCEHAGMSASLWVSEEFMPGRESQWMQIAHDLSRLAFPADIQELIDIASAPPRWAAQPNDAGMVLELASPEDLQITVEVISLTPGSLVTVTYAYR